MNDKVACLALEFYIALKVVLPPPRALSSVLGMNALFFLSTLWFRTRLVDVETRWCCSHVF